MSWNKDLYFCEPIVEILRPVPVLALFLFSFFGLVLERQEKSVDCNGFFRDIGSEYKRGNKSCQACVYPGSKNFGGKQEKQIFRTIILRAITPEIIGVSVLRRLHHSGLRRQLNSWVLNKELDISLSRHGDFYTHGVIFGILLFSLLSWVADTIIRK